MNEQRFVVSDVLLQRFGSDLSGKFSDAGATAKDNRLFLPAVLWRVRTGSPWRDLPPAIGTASSGGFAGGPSLVYSRVFSKQ
jgi:hypothetical protein